MRIGTRLALLFSALAGGLLLIYATSVYWTAKADRKLEFYEVLRLETLTKVKLFFEANLGAEVLQNLYAYNRQMLNEVEVAIFEAGTHKLCYHDAVEVDVVKETPSLLQEIEAKGLVFFELESDWQVVGLAYVFEAKTYVVTAAAYDGYGYGKLRRLRDRSLIIGLLSILVLYLLGRFFAHRALEPLRKMREQAEDISAQNLHLRLPLASHRDELSDLAETFNGSLERLERSFGAQRDFVSNLSHELRTPLSAMVAELDLMILERGTEDKVLGDLRADVQKLVRLLNSLLDLAKAEYDSSHIKFKLVSLDEVLVQARAKVLREREGGRLDLYLDPSIDPCSWLVEGNEYLLQVALGNLMDNAIKFSKLGEKVKISLLRLRAGYVCIEIEDRGMGISPEDRERLFEAFFRSDLVRQVEGHGIGLFLCQKIVHLHRGYLELASELGFGSRFRVFLPSTN